jgi:hypothetical protein
MLRALIATLLFLLSNSVVAGGTYYVAVNGKPDGDGSLEQPWPSVEIALAKLKGGHTIILRPGVYRGPIRIPDVCTGSEQAPTIIKSEEKWKAVIAGSPEHGIFVGDRCNWTIVDGFEVLGARYDGIKGDGQHVVIRNCWVHHNTQMGIAAHHSVDTTIENNLIEFNGCHIQFDHGIYADGDRLTIRGNIIRHNAAFGIHLYPAVQNSTVCLNLVYGHEHHAGVLLVCDKKGGANQVIHNTIAGNVVALEIWKGNGTVIANNILTTPEMDPLLLDHGTDQVLADYNLCLPKSSHAEAHGISADPLFVDARHGAYWLRGDSPAIGKGTPEHALLADFWSRPASKDKTPDLGAFAYVPFLAEAKSRATWLNNWGYGYHPKRMAQVPDFWQLPGEGAGGEGK